MKFTSTEERNKFISFFQFEFANINRTTKVTEIEGFDNKLKEVFGFDKEYKYSQNETGYQVFKKYYLQAKVLKPKAIEKLLSSQQTGVVNTVSDSSSLLAYMLETIRNNRQMTTQILMQMSWVLRLYSSQPDAALFSDVLIIILNSPALISKFYDFCQERSIKNGTAVLNALVSFAHANAKLVMDQASSKSEKERLFDFFKITAIINHSYGSVSKLSEILPWLYTKFSLLYNKASSSQLPLLSSTGPNYSSLSSRESKPAPSPSRMSHIKQQLFSLFLSAAHVGNNIASLYIVSLMSMSSAKGDLPILQLLAMLSLGLDILPVIERLLASGLCSENPTTSTELQPSNPQRFFRDLETKLESKPESKSESKPESVSKLEQCHIL